jgi:DNA-binding MarR family transcriptional regulator
LRSLYEQDGLSQIELSGRVGVTPATATGVLDTMESLGLVTRVRDETDRRKTKIYLTRRGKALRRPLLEALEGVNRVILAGITEQQWKAFCHVLDTMTANVEAHRENRQAVTPKESRPTRKVKLSA